MALPASLTGHRGAGSATTTAQTGTGASLALGLEAIYEYNGLLLNDKRVLEKYRLTSVTAYDDPDVRSSRQENPTQHGERRVSMFYGGRLISLQGRIEAYNLEKMRDMQAAIKAAFNAPGEKLLKIYSTNTLSTEDVQITCEKPQPITMPEQQPDGRFFREFMIPLRASNPRFVSQTLNSPSYLAVGATINATAFTINNTGDYPAQPVIKIRGPLTNPNVRVNTTLDELVFKPGITIPSGREWTADIAAGTLVDDLGVNQFNNLDVSSDWPEIPPGSSGINFSGTSATIGTTRLIVDWRATWL
jgi:hypothetical protein